VSGGGAGYRWMPDGFVRPDARAPAPAGAPRDPIHYCVLTTMVLIAWLVGAAPALLLASSLALLAYRRAYLAGLRDSRCRLRRPWLIFGYLGLCWLAALAGTARLIRRMIG
jgi:hypothetical protein